MSLKDKGIYKDTPDETIAKLLRQHVRELRRRGYSVRTEGVFSPIDIVKSEVKRI